MRLLLSLLLWGIAALGPVANARAATLARGWVPSALLPQGQTRLVEDAEGLRLEILLHSRFMDRVVRAIIEKEKSNWPADDPDAAAYIRWLTKARAELGDARGKQSLKITFALLPQPGSVAWHTGEVREDKDGNLVMDAPRLLCSYEPSRAYLVRNAVLILEDSLKLKPPEIDKLLRTRLPGEDLPALGAAYE